MRVIIGSPDPGFEPIILDVKDNFSKEYYDKDDECLPESLYYYARNVIRGCWPETESIIMKDSWSAYCYTCFIIKGRWPEAESIIMNNPYHAYYYARDVIKGRWPEAEQYIKQDKCWWNKYYRFIKE